MTRIHFTEVQEYPQLSWETFLALVQRLPRKESPGADQITNEAIMKLQGLTLHGTFELPTSWEHAVIVTIPTAQKDFRILQNLGPTSLLNGVPKVLEAVLKAEWKRCNIYQRAGSASAPRLQLFRRQLTAGAGEQTQETSDRRLSRCRKGQQ